MIQRLPDSLRLECGAHTMLVGSQLRSRLYCKLVAIYPAQLGLSHHLDCLQHDQHVAVLMSACSETPKASTHLP